MENEVKELVQTACSWTPELLVDLGKSALWPVTVIILALWFKGGIVSALTKFFSKSSVTEFSAGAAGVSAKFKVDQQNTETAEISGRHSTLMPESMSIESINSKHQEYETQFSSELYDSIRKHISALKIDNETAIEILMKENSLLQSAIKYFEINKVLFRSQYNLLDQNLFDCELMTTEELNKYFLTIKVENPEALADWDYVRYLSYPVTSGLIKQENEGYKLTVLGISYVIFMRKNIQLISDLSKL